MADTKVSALGTIGSIDRTTDYFYIVDASGPTSNKVTVNGALGITGDPVGHTDTQTLSNKTLGSSNIFTIRDDRLTLQDNGDATKQANLQLSGITTGNTRVYTLPDRSGTLVTLNGSQTFTGVITAPGAILDQATITRPTLQVDSIAEYTAATGVTIDGLLIKDGLLPAGNIQPLNLVSGTGSTWVWQAWSPTWTNLSVGNGTVTARYLQIGKNVHFSLNLVFGSTTSITGTPTFSLPVQARALVGADSPIAARGKFLDSGTAAYDGFVMLNTATTGQLQLSNAAGTYVSFAGISSTTPMTWTTNDEMKFLNGIYEAA